MREFNTSGPNNPKYHYTIFRKNLVEAGKRLVYRKKYFTVWAPRQTGKSTWFRQLKGELEKEGYLVAHINFESYKNASLTSFLERLLGELERFWGFKSEKKDIAGIFYQIERITGKKLVLIIDEVEGINFDYFGDFLHAIRNAYHSRDYHSLHSVILVGVSNITGIVQDNASPFNIADNLDIPFFNNKEVLGLLRQHEEETGQLFSPRVAQKICEITANQPGLVNGFANQLVSRYPDKKVLDYNDYLEVEQFYLTRVIDKNISNVIKYAKQHREFVEKLLFVDKRVPFKIDRLEIEKLHTNGLIIWDDDNNIKFWVPLYKKRLFDAFYPYTNGENKFIMRSLPVYEIFDGQGNFRIKKLISAYKTYVKRRGFRAFREKDDEDNYKSIPEAVMAYSFETYIQAFLTMVDGKSYREAQASLGDTDLVVNISNKEYLFETKVYRYPKQFEDGKGQLAYYAKSLSLDEAVYLVFIPNNIQYPGRVQEADEIINGVRVQTFLVKYDEEKDFGIKEEI